MSLPAQFEGALRAALSDSSIKGRYRAGISASALATLIAAKLDESDADFKVFVELPVDKMYGKRAEECEIPVVLGTSRRQNIHVALVDKRTGTLYTLTLWPVNMQLIPDDSLCIRATGRSEFADAIEDLVENGFNNRGRANGRLPDNYIMQTFDRRMGYVMKSHDEKADISLIEFGEALHRSFGLKNTQTIEAWRSYYPWNRVFEVTRITSIVYSTLAYVNRAEVYVAFSDRMEIAEPEGEFIDTSAGEPEPTPASASYVDTPAGRIEITPDFLRAIASAMEQKVVPPS